MWHKFLLSAAHLYLRRQVRRRPPRPLAELEPRTVRRVLLLNATGLGDLMFATPAIRALKSAYPEWQLELLVHARFASLVEYNPHLTQLWQYRGRTGLFKLMSRLQARNFDLAVILHGNDPEATLLAQASGSPFIIGSSRSPLALAYAARVPPSSPWQHAIERRLDFVRLLGAEAADPSMELFLPPAAEAEAEAVLQRQFGSQASRLMALHPTGSGAYKWWPGENFAALGTYLYERHRAPLLIISGGQDRPAAEALAGQLPGPTLVTGGRYPLPTVAGLLKRARLLVANDSGPLHLALALGVPAVALIGADHPARIGPYRVDWGTYLYRKDAVCREERCLNKKCPDNRCLQAIEPAEVIRTIETWWEPRFGNSRGVEGTKRRGA
jgi:ADP-heptose:LPS heptosyltransferase